MLKRWNLRNVILLTLISIFCGVIFWGSDFLYNGLVYLTTPIGMKPFANEIIVGIYLIAGPLSACLFRVPGSATLGEIIASVVEMFLGSQFGVMGIIAGLIQGVGSEAGFALTGYRHFDWLGVTASSITATVVTFAYDWFYMGYGKLTLPMIIGIVIVRFISIMILSGWLPLAISHKLIKSHVIQLHR